MRVAFHDPTERALRNLRDAEQRALGEVAAADEAHLVLAAAAAEPERVRERQAREPSCSSVGLVDAEPLEVDVQRRPVVERVDAVAGARGDEHRLADPPPAVAHADPQRRVRRDPGGHDRVGEDPVAVELERPGHLQVVAGAAAHERHAGPQHP